MKKIIVLLGCAVMALAANVLAEVNIPYTFEAGTPAKAAEVNANFKALQDAIETALAELDALKKENRALKTTLADLQAQIDKLAKQVAAAPKQSAAAATPAPIPAAKGPRLRSKPVTVSEKEAQQQFNVDANWRPRRYVENDFEDQGEVVIDHATGLMWQKSGSDNALTYQETQAYIKQLNRERFAGYNDWRLPTVNELLSLVEQNYQSKGIYINPLFDSRQLWCWTADKSSAELVAWRVNFSDGAVNWYSLNAVIYVRAVRP